MTNYIVLFQFYFLFFNFIEGNELPKFLETVLLLFLLLLKEDMSENAREEV